MAEITTSMIALLAQLTIADGAALSEANIDISIYRDSPDFAAIEVVNEAYKNGTAMPEYSPNSWLGFVFSKPSIDDGKISIHALEVLDDNGSSTGELWLKLKSRAALVGDDQINADDNKKIAETVQNKLFDAAGVVIDRLNIEQSLLESGPDWLKKPIEVNIAAPDKSLELPMVITPLNVPERFAGHCYLKLMLPTHPALIDIINQ